MRDLEHVVQMPPPLHERPGLVLPANHPLRFELNNEVHARPPEALRTPCRISYLALLSPFDQREREWQRLDELARRYDAPPPRLGANHYSGDFGPFRLKWERHTEFARYKIIVPASFGGALAEADPFALPALAAAPPDWVGALPGELVAAAHTVVQRPDPAGFDQEAIASAWFGGNTLIGAHIGGGAGTALTDFRIHADGFSRLVLIDRGMSERQCGRMVQRLMEIETYRILALLALPVARDLAPALGRCEHELAHITGAMAGATEADEPVLLDRLTRLEAEIEGRLADNHYRFSAAVAYHELVLRRIAELREERIQGLQGFQEFTERRLAPAMSTCAAVAARQNALSERVARATQLLSTRVDLTRERQNQAVLESMNRRAKLQLRLQQTVEGLSIAAVTYYVVGLVGYFAKGAKAAGVAIDAEIAVAVAIPLVALLVGYGVRKTKRLVRSEGR